MSHVFGFNFLVLMLPIFYLLAIAANVAIYVFYGLGLYNMANNTGMKNPWLAWIPFCRDYLTGSIADRYNQNMLKKASKWRIILPAVKIAMFPVSYIFIFGAIFALNMSYEIGGAGTGIRGFAVVLPFLLIIFAMVIAETVVYLICVNKLFQDYEPSRSVIYTVISFFGLACIPMFISRNNVPVGVAGVCQPKQPQYTVVVHEQPSQSQYSGEPYEKK